MRSSYAIVLLVCSLLTSLSQAQQVNKRVTIHCRAHMDILLLMIFDTSDDDLSYIAKEMRDIIVDLNVTDVTPLQALDSLCNGRGFKYDTMVTSKGRLSVRVYRTLTPPLNDGINEDDYLPQIISARFLDRMTGPNLADRIPWNASGLLIGPGPNNSLGWSIRGTHTFFSPSSPLVVLDKFTYPGMISDLNPNDIASVTILKDAAASSIWGSYASNGVVVLDSKEGYYRSQNEQVLTASMNTTLTERPNLSYGPRLSSSSYIGAEKQFFNLGYYDAGLYDPIRPLSPVVQLLKGWRNGTLSGSAVDSHLDQLAKHNSLDDLRTYFYQKALSRQYHISLTGNGPTDRYYLSGGYDGDATNLVRNKYERYTLHGSYNSRGIVRWLETGLTFDLSATNRQENNPGLLPLSYPYAQLVDSAGRPMTMNYKYNGNYLDTAGAGRLLDWNYRPLDELRMADNRSDRYIGNIQGNLSFILQPNLTASLLGQFFRGRSSTHNYYSEGTFFTRDLINQFTEINGPDVFRPIPIGGILIASDTDQTGYNLRTQVNYKLGPENNRLTSFTQAELSDLSVSGWTHRSYGLDARGVATPMDLVNNYPSFVTQVPQQIPGNGNSTSSTSRFADAFTSLSYSYHRSTNLYGSFRVDGSNIDATAGHARYNPFWSLGLSRTLTGDSLSLRHWLKLRMSYGSNGNVSNRTAYLTTQSLGLNPTYRVPQAAIANPPDPHLSWEKTYILNAGLDLSLFRSTTVREGRLNGSLDVYYKRARDLLATESLPSSAGLFFFQGNSAGIDGVGMDLVLNSLNIVDTRHRFSWGSTLLLSLVSDRVSSYRYRPASPISYVSGTYPMIGRSPTALFSYRSAGLDPNTGDPRGYIGAQVSRNYEALVNDPNAAIEYSGSYQPMVFGSLLNTIKLGRFGLSTLLSFKAGYVIRRPSIDYNSLFSGASSGSRDYDLRWIRPGDERRTTVPSFPSINDPVRDAFYQSSNELIVKGDHIRLQDIRFTYSYIPKDEIRRQWHLRQALFYLYVNNIGILWRSNRYGIDPDAINNGNVPAPKSYSLGVKLDLDNR